MDQIFNLKRFSKLFVKHTADNYKTYLMSLGVLMGIMFLVASFITYLGGGNFQTGLQEPFFINFIFISGSIFTSTIFSDLGKKKNAIAILTLPASNFEKFLIGWLWSYLIFQIVFIMAFYAIICCAYLSFNYNLHEIRLIDLFSGPQKTYMYLIIYAALHAMVLLGSVYFSKGHFIKIAFTLFVSYFLLFFLNNLFFKLTTTGLPTTATPFLYLDVHTGSKNPIRIGDYDDSLQRLVSVISVITVILWVATFYRFKEKEV